MHSCRMLEHIISDSVQTITNLYDQGILNISTEVNIKNLYLQGGLNNCRNKVTFNINPKMMQAVSKM